MTALDNAPGVYGKLPIFGDFISRRLPGEFIRCWDTWLQSIISASRQQLGTEWLKIYLTSPIWHFILSPGVCGASAWGGVLIPSVDKVGRYFPLTLAMSIHDKKAVPGLFMSAFEWFEKLEEIALAALQDDFSMGEFDQNLEEPPLQNPISISEVQHAGNNHNSKGNPIAFYVEMENLSDMAECLNQISGTLLSILFPMYSLWSTAGSERVKPCLRIYEGLPPAADYREFLTDQDN